MKTKSGIIWRLAVVVAMVLALVPVLVATPAAAATPTGGYTLGASEGNSAVWTTDVADGGPPSGTYVAKLIHAGSDPNKNAVVSFTPPTGITLASLVAAPTTYGFSYLREEPKIGPSFEILFSDGALGWVAVTIELAYYDYLDTGTWADDVWHVRTVAGTTEAQYYGDDFEGGSFDYEGSSVDLSTVIDAIKTKTDAEDTVASVGAWEMTEVRVDVGWSNDAQTAYIDDVIIDSVSYDLEMSHPVIIDSPTTASPGYIAPPGYLTVEFTIIPDNDDAVVDLEVYKGLTVIGTKTVDYADTLTLDESQRITESVYITAAALDGSYDLSVAVDDGTQLVSATLVDAVVVDRANPTVTIDTSVAVAAEPVGTTDGDGDLTGSLTYTPIVAYSVTMTDGTKDCTDDGTGTLAGELIGTTGTGTINYATGDVTITGGVHSAAVTADYTASSVDVINENVATFSVIATFDKPMAAVVPTITFAPDVVYSETLTIDSGSSDWTANNVYTAVYDVADVSEEVAGVDVSVDGATDQAGNPQTPDPTKAVDLFDVDTINPTLDSMVWTDADDSRGVSAGDTLLLTFSEAMDTSTVATGTLSADLVLSGGSYGTGATVAWSGADKVLTVTLGTGGTIADGTTVTPALTVTDVAGNTAIGPQSIQDDKGPKLVSITWWDLDASGTINAGAPEPDTLVFLFSEDMKTSTVTAANLATALVLSGGSYGTGATVDWGTPEGDDSLTVTLGTGASIIPTIDTVDPANTVTDAADPANPDDTVLPVGIVQGVIVSFEAPATVLPGDAVDVPITITYVTDIDAGNFQVTFDPAVLQLDGVTAGEIGGTEIPAIYQLIYYSVGDEIPIVTGATIVVNVPDLGESPTGATGEGTLAVLNFTFIGVSGEQSILELVEDAGTLSDKTAQAINAQWVDPDPATVTATKVVGDANGNGTVNALDITKIELDIAAGRGVWTDPAERLLGLVANPGADANDDGFLNALDITRIELLVATA